MVMLLSVMPLGAVAAEYSATQNSQPTKQVITKGEQSSDQLTYVGMGVDDSTLSGTGTEADPYLISDGYDLLYFAQQVNTGATSYFDQHIRLENNIDLENRDWEPVGYLAQKPFEGHFHGDYHEIINFSVKLDTSTLKNDTVYYIGFFGYIKGAQIENLGINHYSLDQTYTYDTEIGAMAAHAEGSRLTNCYANGEICAAFTDSNPLERSDVIELTSVPSVLDSENENENGQGVIIDLRAHPTDINQTMTIQGNVSAVRILGQEGTTYNNINIIIAEHEYFPILIELRNVNICGNSADATISCSSGRNIYFNSCESENSIINTNGAAAVSAPNSPIGILGTAPFTLHGGDGADGVSNGVAGGAGGAGIACKELQVDLGGALTVQGGNGGNGASGSTYSGQHGASGSSGGNGGNAIDCETLNVVNVTDITVIGGNGGNGGQGLAGKQGIIDNVYYENGGNGGNGGDGGDAGHSVTGIIRIMNANILDMRGGDGGDGGKGGNGGKGGDQGGTYWFAEPKGFSGGNAGSGGDGGCGGDGFTVGEGGDPGLKGTIGKGTSGNYFIGIGVSGSNGSPGNDGDPGTDGNLKEYEVLDSIPQDNAWTNATLSAATLVAGGFVGVLDSTSSAERCAAMVNNISAQEGLDNGPAYNNVTAGNFAAEAAGSITNSLCAYMQDSVPVKYDLALWCGQSPSQPTESPVFMLCDGTDTLGLVYDNGIADNKLRAERTVDGWLGEAETLTIPEYVYDGRFIGAVTEIADKAFFGNQYLKNVTCAGNVTHIGTMAFSGCTELETAVLGDSVTTVGSKLFSECSALSSITIGASLSSIPEFNSKRPVDCTTPFGIDKTNSVLKEYIVAEENLYFDSIDGILYEKFRYEYPEGTVNTLPVAVIDAPVEVEIPDGIYAPADYVIRIFPYAFQNNRTVKQVQLQYIRDVGAGAFKDCRNLTSVVFAQLETSDETVTILGQEYQKACEVYTTNIGASAFENCQRLSHIDLSSAALRKIGINAFSGCATATSAEPLTIKLGVNISMLNANTEQMVNDVEFTQEEMKKAAFSSAFSNAKVEAFQVVEGSSHFFAEDGVLFYRTGQTDPNTQKEIAWLAAYPRYAQALSYEAALAQTSKYSLTYISPEAFKGNMFLEQLTVADGITGAGNQAFAQMQALHRLEMSQTLTDLSIEPQMFLGCGSLAWIQVAQENPKYSSVDGVLFDKAQSRLIKYPAGKANVDYTVAQQVSQIEQYAFSENGWVQYVTVDGVTTVGVYAFYDCKNLSMIYFANENCDAPFKSVDEVKGSYAFCTGNSYRATMVCYQKETELWKQLSQGDYTDNGIKQFTIAQFVAFPENQEQTGVYAVVVTNKSGALLNDINVKLADDQAINTVGGIALFDNLDFSQPHELRVFDNQGNYFPVINPEFYLDEATRITYITLSSVPTVSGVSVSYTSNALAAVAEASEKAKGSELGWIEVIGGTQQTHDINSQVAKINKWCIDTIDIAISCGYEAGSSITGVRLVQDDTTLITLTEEELTSIATEQDSHGNCTASIHISVSTDILQEEKALYAVVDITDSEGNVDQVEQELKIQVFYMNYFPLDMSFVTNELAITVDDSIPFIGGAEIKLADPKEDRFYVNVGIGADYIRMILNEEKLTKDFYFGNNYEYKSSKTGDLLDVENVPSWEDYLNLVKEKPYAQYKEYKYEHKVGLSLGGYVEMKYKGKTASGQNDFAYTANISGTIKYTLAEGATVWAVIPVRVEVEVTASGKLEATLVFDKEAEQFCTPTVEATLEGSITANAGIGCKVASAGVYGAIKTVMELDIYPNFALDKWTASGDMGVYVKINMLFFKFKKTWSLFEKLGWNNQWVIYENGCWGGTSAATKSINELYNEDNYSLAVSQTPMRSVKRGAQSQANAYSGIAPKLVHAGDLVYIIYHENLHGIEQYDDYNYQKLVYQTYDPSSGEFSKVVNLVEDNGYVDGAFDAYSDGENVYLVYAQMNRLLTQADEENTAATLCDMELKTAVLQNGQCTVWDGALTQDSYYEMHLRLGTLSGQIAAVWVRNEEATLFGATQSNGLSVWYSVLEDDSWSQAQPLQTGIGTITDLEIVNDTVAYITDSNNDLTTMGADGVQGYADRMITVLGGQGTEQEGAYHDISQVDGELVYYSGNNLYTLSSGQAFFDAPIAGLPEEYKVLTDSQGDAKVLLFVGEVAYGDSSEANGSNIFGIFRDNGLWGQPVQITDYGQGVYVTSYDAMDDGSRMLLSVLTSQVEVSGATGADQDDYITQNTFTTQWMDYPTQITVGQILSQPDYATPDVNAALMIEITNSTCQTLTQLPVYISGGLLEPLELMVTEFCDANGNMLKGGLLPGEHAYATLSFNPGDATQTAYNVQVGQTTQSVTLWYSDYAVQGKQVQIGNNDYVVAYVNNKGHLSGQYTLTATLEGQEPITTQLKELQGGEHQYILIPIPSEMYDGTDHIVTLQLNADEEYVLANNRAQVTVAVQQKEGVDTSKAFWVYENGQLLASYDTLARALENYNPESQYIQLRADAQVDCTLTGDLYIDLAGNDLTGTMVTNGFAVYGMDSTTDDYSAEAAGCFLCLDADGSTIVPQRQFKTSITGTVRRYMAIEGLGGYSFHRFYLGITDLSLKPHVTGFGYRAQFYGDEMVQSQLSNMGYSLWLTEGHTITRTTGTFKNQLTLLLKNFQVESHGTIPVHAKVFMTLNDGTVIESETTAYSMCQMVQAIAASFDSFETAQKQAVKAMCEKHPVMADWNISQILTWTEN